VEQLIFIKANEEYLPFIIEAIVASEKANTDIIAYCSLFGIDELIFRNTLVQLFDEDLENTPWYLPYWTIGLLKETPVCALSSWIELEGLGSEAIKLQAMHYLLKDKIDIQAFSKKLQKLQSVNITRVSNYLQLEHLYTAPDYRGNGYMKQLISHARKLHPNQTAQIQLTANNHNALKIYMACGFAIEQTKRVEGLVKDGLLADDCKINLIATNGTKRNN
jgi:GNAT superfamily N-acetyltransferase